VTECWPLIGWGRGYDLSIDFHARIILMTTTTVVSNCVRYSSGESAGSVNRAEDRRRLSKSVRSTPLMFLWVY